MELEVPAALGSTDGPFAAEMALESNQVPIALLRDLLNIVAMKLWATGDQEAPPVLLQMDGDFTSFRAGSLRQVLDDFRDNPDKSFVQYTSDWDIARDPADPAFDAALYAGAELMRRLPQILKGSLNDPSVPITSRLQVLFGGAIQRGIQVPQAERMAAVARKGGYGLTRLRHDELDMNLRLSAAFDPQTIASSDRVVFEWSGRRARLAWQQDRLPPISQWNGAPFSAIDAVRAIARFAPVVQGRNGLDEALLLAVNRTLQRFPIPAELAGVYSSAVDAISAVLEDCGLSPSDISLQPADQGLYYAQVRL
jgi:hypothetical protein